MSRSPGFPLLLGLLGLLGLLPPLAEAQPISTSISTRLRYERGEGAEGCGAEEVFVARVEAQLGRAPFSAEGERELLLQLRGGEGAWEASLALRDAAGALRGARDLSIEAEGCGPLLEALSLIVALILDPGWAGAPEEPREEPTPIEEPAPPPSAVLGVPRSAATEEAIASEENSESAPADEEPSSGVAWGLHAFAVFLAGWAPHPAFGGGLRLALWPDPLWSIEISVAALHGEDLTLGVGSLLFVGARGGVELCARPIALDILRLGGCAGVHAGGLYAEPSGPGAGSQSALAPHLDLAAALHLALLPLSSVPGLELRLSAGAAAVLLRGGFTVADPGGSPVLVHQVEPALAFVTLGVGLRL